METRTKTFGSVKEAIEFSKTIWAKNGIAKMFTRPNKTKVTYKF